MTFFVCKSKKQLDFLGGVPIGYPLDNTIIYLLDSNLQPVKSGEMGELYVSGMNLFQGYVSGRDSERFIDNSLSNDPTYPKLYKSCDFAVMRDDLIFYEGRTDSQIKIRGHRVDLTEIEMHLMALEYVKKGTVLCYRAGEIDQTLIAFCAVDDDQLNKPNVKTCIQIENDLNLKLASYMIPHVVVLDSIPLLVNEKVDRQSLLKMYENINTNSEIEMDFDGIDGKSLVKAEALFAVIRNTVGHSIRSKLTKSENFYELGGDSLNSIATIAELRKKGFFISITDFIKASSLGEIIENLSDDEKDSRDSINHCEMKLTCLPLALDHNEAIDLVATSFCGKGDLEQYVKDDNLYADYVDVLEQTWSFYIARSLSFVVKDVNGRIVGASLNYDAYDEPKVDIPVYSKLFIIEEITKSLENPIL